MSRLTLVLLLGSAALLANYLLKKTRMEDEELVDRVERYLKVERIQSFVDPKQQALIRDIEQRWNNESYTSWSWQDRIGPKPTLNP